MKTLFLIVVAGIVMTHVDAQNIDGFWKGTLSMQGCFPTNNIELKISGSGESLRGDSYHYQDINNYVKKNFKGSYDRQSKKLFVQEGIVTTYHIPYHCQICIKNFDLTYSREGNLETLKGIWKGKVKDTEIDCREGSIILTRIKESAFKEVPEIKVDTGTIRLDFYDNAEVDGDSITVLVNKKVVISHHRLTIKPLTTFLRIDLNNTFHEIEMRAENLGSIPPNTALLMITAGTKTYRLYLSSSQEKNAMVRFVYEPD